MNSAAAQKTCAAAEETVFPFLQKFSKKVLTTDAICDIIIHVVGTILPKNEAIMPNCVMVAPMTLTHVV